MIWKNIVGYKGLYFISSTGLVKNIRGKVLCPSKRQYLSVNLLKNKIYKTHNIHRLVATHFLPVDKNKPVINHKDGNKYNNNVENLEWCTCGYNNDHAFINKLREMPSSSNHHKSVQVKDTNTGAKYETIKDASKSLNIPYSTLVYRVKKHKSTIISITT